MRLALLFILLVPLFGTSASSGLGNPVYLEVTITGGTSTAIQDMIDHIGSEGWGLDSQTTNGNVTELVFVQYQLTHPSIDWTDTRSAILLYSTRDMTIDAHVHTELL